MVGSDRRWSWSSERGGVGVRGLHVLGNGQSMVSLEKVGKNWIPDVTKEYRKAKGKGKYLENHLRREGMQERDDYISV